MSCWDFVFSSVKTHIDDLVRQADKVQTYEGVYNIELTNSFAGDGYRCH